MLTIITVLVLLLVVTLIVIFRQRQQLKQLRVQKQQFKRRQRRLRALLDNVPDLIYVKDNSGQYLECNRAFAAFVGKPVEHVCQAQTPQIRDGAELEAADAQVLTSRYIQSGEHWVSHYDGRPVLLESQKIPIHGTEGSKDTVLSISRDITRQKHDELLLRLQTNVLDLVLRGEAQDIVLHSIVQQVEAMVPEMICSILLLDREREHLQCVAAPGLPEFYNDAIDGMAIGQGIGSCGHAASTAELTIVGNIKTHPYWTPFRELALQAGVAACWSQPIFGSHDEVVGTFAIYYPRPWEPDAVHLELIRAAAQLTGLVLERQQTEAMLQKMYRAVEQSPSMVLITDARGAIEYVNEEFVDVTGYSAVEVIGLNPRILSSGDSDLHLYEQMWQSISVGQDWHGELLNCTKAGVTYWSSLSISPITNEVGDITHYVSISEDISKQKETQAQIERLAFYDPLTKLGNRRLFREQLDLELRKVQRQGRFLGMLYLDLDNFKQINDGLGHDVGDLLLQQVADRLRETLRDSDIIARLGGDEFVVLIPEARKAGLARVANKLIERLVEPYQLQGQSVIVTASVGVTVAPEDGRDAAQLMKNADLAMYRAKHKGRNNFQFFTAEMNDEVMRRIQFEKELREGLEQGQFQLHYQPQWALDDPIRLVGVEALLRWQHPEKGWVSPADFIPLAEELGLIVPLGEWVMHEACHTIAALQQPGQPLLVAVNLSLRQFRDPNLLPCIRGVLAESGLPAHCLELEITESMVMDDEERVLRILQSMRELGVKLAIDDFGSGYSSLSYLKKLPVHQLKVDASFVRDIPHDRNDMEITAAVIAMSHKLGLGVVAEGIETEAQLDFLRQHQCDTGQGYLLARPVPLPELKEILARHHV